MLTMSIVLFGKNINLVFKALSKLTKRILLITQWFDPEPTFKGLLFARELASRGFDVEVITGFPNYPGGSLYEGYRLKLLQKETIDGVLVTRVPLYPSHNKSKFGRIINYLSFALSSLFYGLIFAKKPDVIYAYNPPLTVGISASIIKLFRRAPIVLDIQDMWPDTLKATGMINNRWILAIVSKICNQIYSSVTKIVVLSPGFKKLLIDRGVPGSKIEIIYNWADEKFLRNTNDQTSSKLDSINGFKIMFAGNIGKAQGLDVILDAAALLKAGEPTARFIILGQGLQLNELKRSAATMNLDNIYFLPSVGMEKVGYFLSSADALLIHLNSSPLFEITIPGKTQAYMAIGKPIIMGVKGDASNLVSRAECGFCFEPENSDALVSAVKDLMSLAPAERETLGKNAETFYNKNLSVKIGVNSWAKVFEEVIAIQND